METQIRTEEMVRDAYIPPQISWGAIFAGWFISAAVALILYVLGSAIGLTAINAADANAVEKGIALGTVVWIFLSWAASMYIGGFFASCLSGKANKLTGMIHGISVWSFTSVFALVLGISGLGGLLQIGQTAAETQTGQQAMQSFQNTLRDQASQTAMERIGADPEEFQKTIEKIDPRTWTMASSQLLSQDTEGARKTLSAQAGLTKQQIEQVMNYLTVQTEQVKAGATQALHKVQKYTTAALWVTFFSSLIGLLCACFGAVAGSRWAPASYEVRSTLYREEGREYEKRKHVA